VPYFGVRRPCRSTLVNGATSRRGQNSNGPLTAIDAKSRKKNDRGGDKVELKSVFYGLKARQWNPGIMKKWTHHCIRMRKLSNLLYIKVLCGIKIPKEKDSRNSFYVFLRRIHELEPYAALLIQKRRRLRRNKPLPSESMHSVKFQRTFHVFIQSLL